MKRNEFRARLGAAAFVWLISCAPLLAEQGTGISSLFTVDTRWGFSQGAAVSGYFTVDTRLSGSASAGFSGLFTVDTLGATTGTAIIAGRVTDSGGTGLGAVTVSVLRSGILRAQTATDSAGNYALGALPAASYDLRAQKVGYGSGTAPSITVVNGATAWQNFTLQVIVQPPPLVETTRPPELPNPIANSQLKRFVNGNWVTVTSTSDVDREKPTVIFTHGFVSNPDAWAKDMAAKMIQGGVTDVNLLAWDWSANAGKIAFSPGDLAIASGLTPSEGRKLAQKLSESLGTGYEQGIHFIGHSLGTLVNGTAANYLHKQTGGAFSPSRTQITLLDNAEMVNVGGHLLIVGPVVAGFESVLAVFEIKPVGWVSPLPENRAWADNYISGVGFYHATVVNAWLPKKLWSSAQPNVFAWFLDAHVYAHDWYADTALNPGATLGHRYSFERLGPTAQFPSPSPYPKGTLLTQFVEDDYTLTRVTDVARFIAEASAEFAKTKLVAAANTLEETGDMIGNAYLDMFESYVSFWRDTREWIGEQAVVSFRAVLRSAQNILPSPNQGGGLALRKGGPLGADDYTNSPSAVWLPVRIPANAAFFSFDFAFTGDAGQDTLSVSIAGTNVFALEAQDMPEGQTLNSGVIDVTPWQGQTVELFFGLLGGTSTNTTITITAMRFYQIDPPLVAAEVTGTDIVVSWPATVTGYSLQSVGSLTTTNWMTVTNIPTLSGMRQYVTNSITESSRFYRLIRN